jgi:hypothetical protein
LTQFPVAADVVAAAAGATFDKPLVTNVFRAVLAEAIVSMALPQWRWASADYASVDFLHPDGRRLEVKQSAARQSWPASRPSRASWDIAPRTGRWTEDAIWVAEPGRNADIYVLCHHPEFGDHADHRDPAQWRFYVISAASLPETKSLSLAGAERLASAVRFGDLAHAVERCRV